MTINRESDAWLRMLEFIKVPDNDYYEFVYAGNKFEAKKFIHRMRVELSRARGMATAAGKALKIFKMNIKKIEEFTGEIDAIDERSGKEVRRKIKKCNIKLQKAIPGSGEVQKEIQSFFKDITVEGNVIDG